MRRITKFQLTPEQRDLAERNMDLARHQAWIYKRKTGIEYKVLESEAFLGLCQAAAKYDINRLHEQTGQPLKFSSLAVPYIRGSILHYIRDKTYAMRLTYETRDIWTRGKRYLYAGFTDLEVCEILGIELSKWQEAKSACSGPPLELADHATPSEPLEPDEVDNLTIFRQDAAELLSKLTPATRQRLDRFMEARASDVPKTVINELRQLVFGG